MRIRFSDIPAEGLRIKNSLELSSDDFREIYLKICAPVEVDIFLQKSGNLLQIQGQCKAVFKTECARCCALIDYEFDKSFKAEYKADNRDDIDVRPLITEEILLILPLRILCRDDCKGLCKICGQDLNIDSCRHQRAP